MRRELFFIIGLSSAIYATQEISCVDFVNMSKNEAQSYLDEYRRDFQLNHFKIKKHTDADRAYIGMQGGVSKHLLNCIDLRRISHYGVENVRRALTLTALSKKSLAPEESSIYQAKLNKNISHYSRYTNSSIDKVNHLPLVFLTIQRSKDKRHYIIYEFRQNGADIKRYSKKISIYKPYISGVSQDYLSYLNSNSINPRLTNHVPSPSTTQTKEYYMKDAIPEYEVIASMNAMKEPEKTERTIPVGSYVRKSKTINNTVYFTFENEEYYILKKYWNGGIGASE